MEINEISEIQPLLQPEHSAIITARLLESIAKLERLEAEAIAEERMLKEIQLTNNLTWPMAAKYVQRSERSFRKIVQGTDLGSNIADLGKKVQNSSSVFIKEELNQLIIDGKWVIGNSFRKSVDKKLPLRKSAAKLIAEG